MYWCMMYSIRVSAIRVILLPTAHMHFPTTRKCFQEPPICLGFGGLLAAAGDPGSRSLGDQEANDDDTDI